MSRRIYNKNLTFLQDQPFAENLLAGFSYKKRKANLISKRDPFIVRQLLNNNIKSSIGTDTFPSNLYPAKQGNNQKTSSNKARVAAEFGFTRGRNKSEKMKKAEASLIKHFCLILERLSSSSGLKNPSVSRTKQSFVSEGVCNFKNPYNEEHKSLYARAFGQRSECSNELQVGNIIPHLLVSIDSMQNTLLATRGSRSTERIKAPSHFKKILRESRKIRLLYGNLSKQQLFRGTSKMRLPGENLLIWLESRLDVVLERCGFFGSIKAARQSVLRGNITVNSKVVKSPGFILQGGDLIRIVQKDSPFNPLVGHFSRGAILSNEVSPYILRKKNLATAFSNILQKSKTASLSKHTLLFNRGFNKIVDKSFDTADLDKKILAPKNWRFRGSPHLLFSLFFFHGYLQKVISFVANTCNKNVSIDKKFVKLFSYKKPKWNNTSTRNPEITPNKASPCYSSNPSSLVMCRTHFYFPTIFFTSKHCGINRLALNTESFFRYVYKRERSSIDTLNIELFLNCSRQFLQKIRKNGTFGTKVGGTSFTESDIITNTRNFFGEGFVRALPEFYNNLFPWFNCSDQANATESRTRLSSTEKGFDYERGDLFQIVSGLLKKNEESLFSVVFTDLLLYALLVKKELASLHTRRSRVSEERAFYEKKKLDKKNAVTRQSFVDKKTDLNVRLNLNIEKRIKPLHLEVSYQSLCAVYLFPPQRVCLPIMVDLECLAKTF